jgi:hypothetical protein
MAIWCFQVCPDLQSLIDFVP